MKLSKTDTLYLTDKGIELHDGLLNPTAKMTVASLQEVNDELKETLSNCPKSSAGLCAAINIIDRIVGNPTIRNIERTLRTEGKDTKYITEVVQGIETGFEKEYITTKY